MRIGITAGCPVGVGPEVVAAALARVSLDAQLVFVGNADVLAAGARVAGVEPRVETRALGRTYAHGGYGAPGADDLAYQRDALLLACALVKSGELDAIVTGPVRKSALVVDGRAYPGQT